MLSEVSQAAAREAMPKRVADECVATFEKSLQKDNLKKAMDTLKQHFSRDPARSLVASELMERFQGATRGNQTKRHQIPHGLHVMGCCTNSSQEAGCREIIFENQPCMDKTKVQAFKTGDKQLVAHLLNLTVAST